MRRRTEEAGWRSSALNPTVIPALKPLGICRCWQNRLLARKADIPTGCSGWLADFCLSLRLNRYLLVIRVPHPDLSSEAGRRPIGARLHV